VSRDTIDVTTEVRTIEKAKKAKESEKGEKMGQWASERSFVGLL
jgi:hypothetical protein